MDNKSRKKNDKTKNRPIANPVEAEELSAISLWLPLLQFDDDSNVNQDCGLSRNDNTSEDQTTRKNNLYLGITFLEKSSIII